MRWKAWVLLVVCLGLVLLASCGRNDRRAWDVLAELKALTEALPTGEEYRSDAAEGSEGYCSSDLRKRLYGDHAEEVFKTVEEYAIYLSFFEMPYEIAVFRCYSASDANRVAAMCLERSDQLQIALRGTDWERYGTDAQIVCKGRWVVMAVTDEPSVVGREALRQIG